MSILLVESHYRSRPWFKAIGRLGLEKVSVISVNKGELRFLNQFFPTTHLLITRIWDIQATTASLLDLEGRLSALSAKYNINFNWIIQTDRTLRKQARRKQLDYLYEITLRVEKSLLLNRPKVVIMEATWAHEFIVDAIASALGIQVLCPGPVRFVNNRILFFKGIGRKDFLLRPRTEVTEPTLARPFEQKPEEFDVLSKRNAITLAKWKTFTRLIRDYFFGYRNRFIQPSIFQEVIRKAVAIGRFYFLKLFAKLLYTSNFPNGKYVLIGLHVQPEASIDVVGHRFRDQIYFVEHLARSLPVDFTLVIKEHPHAVGSRPLSFYRRLLMTKNIQIAHLWNNNHILLRDASLVVTVAGTMSLEAANKGVKAVTAEEMFFSDGLSCRSLPDSVEDLGNAISKLLSNGNEPESNRRKMREVTAHLMKHSFPGKTSAPNQDPYALSTENIENLAKAFSEVLQQFGVPCNYPAGTKEIE